MGKTVRYFNKQDDTETVGKKNEKSKKICNKKNGKKKIPDKDDVLIYKAKLKLNHYIQQKNSVKLHEILKKRANPKPKYPGKTPIDKVLIQKHSRGEAIDVKGVRFNVNKYKLLQKEKAIAFSTEQSARAEILLTETSGILEADSGETTTQFRQHEIAEHVDIAAATKHFNLTLDQFGPYRMRYTRNGRHLLLGGRLGHVAAFDWVTKKLHCELNVMESVHDVCWLHLETMFAVAQKNWVYIYDNQGIELHCLKKLNKVSRMQFLPYHFLLATGNEEGGLGWLDVSIGQMVSYYNSRLGRINMMCQNPWNAVLCAGNTKGVVSMWSPNMKDPLAKMLCHKTSMTALHVDPRGRYMTTAATDRSVKIWDIRKLEGPLQSYRIRASANDVAFSETNLLGMAMGNVVEIYKDCCTSTTKKAYLRHVMNTTVGNISFCPYEDVLGVATARGFTSLLVPGSGEPNFDALEVNPYQTKSQRREAEVKALLEKIQPEFITLDPTAIAELDVPTLQDKLEAKKKLLFVKPPKIDFQSRKKKNKGSSVQATKTKKIMQEQAKRKFIRDIKQSKLAEKPNATKKSTSDKPKHVLDRFISKHVKNK